MEPIPCGGCMFWIPITKRNKDDVQLGECRRYPYPPLMERAKDFWCGEAIARNISPQGGRNK